MRNKKIKQLENRLLFITISLFIEIIIMIAFVFYEVFINQVDFYLLKTEGLMGAILIITYIIGAVTHELINELNIKGER